MDDNATLPVQPYVGPNLGPLQPKLPVASQPINTGNEVPSQLPDVGQPLIPDLGYFSSGSPFINEIVNRLTTDRPGKPRYQMWPERVIRSGLTAVGDALSGNLPDSVVDPNTGEVIPNPEMISRSLDMASLGGVGGLLTAPEEGAASSLGSAPFLRPALKYGDRIYKAPPGATEHSEAIPKHLQDDFYQKAMSGEDINDYKFGFMNHKGQFLNREAALDYGIKEGLVDPQAGKYGVLTSTMLSDSSKPGMAIEAMKPAEPFYSAVEKTIQSAPQQKMQGAEWSNWLKNQPGVKPDEMQHTGIDNWLKSQDRLVTKQQVADYIDNNKIKVNDVVKGIQPDAEAAGKALAESHGNVWEDLSQGDRGRYIRTADNRKLTDYGNDPKYSQYQLPGGKNYQEHLLTLPSKEIKPEINYNGETDPIVRQMMEGMQGLAAEKGVNYKSSHWDEPNIVAHVRTNEREVGGTPSLHIEELQSDWAQAGRKNGFKSDADQAKSKVQNLLKEASTLSTNDARYKEIYSQLPALQTKASSNFVPDMPFKQTEQWAGLGIKRMISKAVNEGKTRISWTPGESQPTNPKNLGQSGEAAEKANQGMKGFYDTMLPKIVERIGKQYGVKVKEGESPKSQTYVDQFGRTKYEPAKVHYFDIPAKMREDVLKKGFPLFSDTSNTAPALAANKLPSIPWQKDPAIGWWKDQNDDYTMYHGTHKDNIQSIAEDGIKAPTVGSTANKVSMTFDPYTAHGYASMGGETGFRGAGVKAKTIPAEDRRVIVAKIPKDWADENAIDMRGNVGSTKDNLINKDKYNNFKGKDHEYYATTELRFKKPIPKEFIRGVTQKP